MAVLRQSALLSFCHEGQCAACHLGQMQAAEAAAVDTLKHHFSI
jgi:hypothetical protein